MGLLCAFLRRVHNTQHQFYAVRSMTSSLGDRSGAGGFTHGLLTTQTLFYPLLWEGCGLQRWGAQPPRRKVLRSNKGPPPPSNSKSATASSNSSFGSVRRLFASSVRYVSERGPLRDSWTVPGHHVILLRLKEYALAPSMTCARCASPASLCRLSVCNGYSRDLWSRRERPRVCVTLLFLVVSVLGDERQPVPCFLQVWPVLRTTNRDDLPIHLFTVSNLDS